MSFSGASACVVCLPAGDPGGPAEGPVSGRLSTFATLHLSDVHHETVDHSGAGAHRLVSFTAFDRYDHIGCEVCVRMHVHLSGAATPTTGCEVFGHTHSF